MKALILTVVLFLAMLSPALAIDEDKKLHMAVGFAIGAGASVVGHTAVKEYSPGQQFLISMAVASPIYMGKELSDMSSTGFDFADFAYDYAGHAIGFWVMQPVNKLLFGESAYDKNMFAVSGNKKTISLNYVARF